MTLPKKRSNVVAVFAHPDDEAFGPCGTLAKLSQSHDVYIFCATKGDVAGNAKLGEIRKKELLESARILGAKKVFFLGFGDGTLSNSLYHALAQKIESKLKLLKPKTLITFEPRGVSGHIDHIVVSLATTYIFYKKDFIRKLLYFCISEEARKALGDYFIYFPPGYSNDQIGKIVNVRDVWDTKIKAMMAHKSQLKDAKWILETFEKLPKEEHFIVLMK